MLLTADPTVSIGSVDRMDATPTSDWEVKRQISSGAGISKFHELCLFNSLLLLRIYYMNLVA